LNNFRKKYFIIKLKISFRIEKVSCCNKSKVFRKIVSSLGVNEFKLLNK